MTPQSSLARATANAAPADTAPLEALDVLTDEADGRSGNIPPALIAAHAIRVTAGADFPVHKAALDALLRRLSSARAQDGFVVRGKPRGASPFGLYRLKGRDSGREYSVLFRFRDPPTSAVPELAGVSALPRHRAEPRPLSRSRCHDSSARAAH